MALNFTPKHIERLYLNEFTPKQFLIIAIETAKKLEWDLSIISETGFIAYINKGIFKWNAKITFKIEGDTATIKSESIENEILDWGKNRKNIKIFSNSLIDLKYTLKTNEINEKYEELKPTLIQPENDILNPPQQTNKNKYLEFFSIFLPKEGFFITPILMYINILIYILMICTGVDFLLPDNESLIMWGANFRPLTMANEWWRLITNCFLHIGIIHILMNMYALLYIGKLLEPHIGKIKFATSFIITGFTASVASLWWHDLTISAGASGAIFGLYGVFLALLTTKIIDTATRKALLASISIFVAYNLLYGLKEGIDNAAHIGGLIGGLVIGFSFYPSLANPEFKSRNLIIGTTSITATVLLSILLILNTPNTIGKFNMLMKEFAATETKAMSFYRIPKTDKEDKELSVIKDEGIPNWKECKNIINQIDSLKDLPSVLSDRTVCLKKYCDYRIASFELMAESIERHTRAYDYQINIYNQKIDLIIRKLQGETIADSLININSVLDFAPNLPKGILYIVDGYPIDDIKNVKPENVKSVLFLGSKASLQLYGEKGKEGSLIILTKKIATNPTMQE